MKQNKLYEAIRRIAWGYVILHVDLNLGPINILPAWWGYRLFLMSLKVIEKEEESAKLLIPLGKMLVGVEILFWVNKCALGEIINLYLISIITRVFSLYFHFQFLTNLAEIARKYGCKEEKTILNLRTAYTLLTTGLCLKTFLESDSIIVIGSILISLIVAVWICSIMFSFSRSIIDKLKEQELAETIEEVPL